jgi:hypothetical protein
MGNIINEELIEMHEKQDYISIAKYIGKNHCNFSDIELNYIDRVWKTVNTEEWIYLSKDMVINDFGYKNTNNIMTNFYKNILLNNFKINKDYKDYKEVDKQYILSNYIDLLENSKIITDHGGHLRKYYIITGECYKNILFLCKTTKSKEIKKYYTKIEDLICKTYKMIPNLKSKIEEEKIEEFEQILKMQKGLLNEEKNKNTILTDSLKNNNVYICISKQYFFNNTVNYSNNSSKTFVLVYNFNIKINNYKIVENMCKYLTGNPLNITI